MSTLPVSYDAMPAGEDERLLEVISRHWGYDSFRPLQRDAMRAVLTKRDSLVVLPTGGGKSLCYQAPALLRDGVTVVVSPLIALMKDQVDALATCGVPAAQLNSSLEPAEQRSVEKALLDGRIRLLFISPERLAVPSFRRLLQGANVVSFAIDEAHCISHWGHDFRPEYRMLRDLHRLFPEASIHAYTATATAQVRDDIAAQLALRDPLVLVGSFDRPNLTYRVVPRRDDMRQIHEVLDRHRGEAGIIYCIRRRDVDDLTTALKRAGFSVVAYHAGLSLAERKRAQDAFANERCDIVVATVAFGMGIDRSNVRFVLHAAMPKSIEHYQQESGRAGRDGLEAECVLLFSPSDTVSWMNIFDKRPGEGEPSEEQQAAARMHLHEMEAYCSSSTCRHRALVEHFGQSFDRPSCGACDVCLGDYEEVPDAQTVAQKIISCVVRMQQPYGVAQLVSVLRGENLEKVRSRGHDRLSTFGILAKQTKAELKDWIGQLIAARVLEIESGQFPVVRLNRASREVLRGERSVRLLRPRLSPVLRGEGDEVSWSGVDRGLFEALRAWRKEEAEARGVPPFTVFSDATLRQLAAVRPSNPATMNLIYGFGEAKRAAYADEIAQLIVEYSAEHALALDRPIEGMRPATRSPEPPGRLTAQKALAFDVFARGGSVDEAAKTAGRARSTTAGYLAEWIASERPASVRPWVSDARYAEVAKAVSEVGSGSLRVIREHVGEHVSYDEIRFVVTHMEATR